MDGPGVLGGKSRHNALVAPLARAGIRGASLGRDPFPRHRIRPKSQVVAGMWKSGGLLRRFRLPPGTSLHGSLCLASKMDADYEAECKQYEQQYFLQLHAIAEEGFQNATGSVTVDDSFRRARMLKLQVPALN